MKLRTYMFGLLAMLMLASVTNAQDKKPNIVFIMGDDVGMWNIGAYHRGMMAGRTPNLDKMAKEGMLFTDYYAEASCTAGRANFITGELPIRTGMTTVGQAGAPTGLPAEACTIATALKAQGYATGQFGKNHLGDKNEFLPTVHGFDEFFGYLYHLDAMEDPAHPNYPQDLLDKVGPRNMVHSWATTTDDATNMPRWGKVGKQKIEDAGTLYPERMKTVDNEIRDFALKFIEKAKNGRQAVLLLAQSDPHAHRHPPVGRSMRRCAIRRMAGRNRKRAWPRLDETSVWRPAESSRTWASTTIPSSSLAPTTAPKSSPGRMAEQRRSRRAKARSWKVVSACPAILRWPGHVPADSVSNGIMSGLDWFPTFLTAAGNPDITNQLLKGVKLGDRTYKNHLDGYDQTAMITGKGPSTRHEIFYLGESSVGAVRIDDYKYRFIDQPQGWLGDKTKVDVPYLTNLRLDPFERQGWPNNGTKEGGQQYFDWFKFQFWRFVFVQQVMGKELQTFLEYPPMQHGASFNLDAVKAEMAKKMAQAEAASKGTGQ